MRSADSAGRGQEVGNGAGPPGKGSQDSGRGGPSDVAVPAVAPDANVDRRVAKSLDDLRALTVGLPDKGDVEFHGDIERPVDVGVRRFLAVERPGAHPLVVGNPEFLRDETPVIMRSDLRDQMQLVGSVAIPVDGGDPQALDLLDRLGQDACVIEVAKEQIDRLGGMGDANLCQQGVADPRAILRNERLLRGVRVIQRAECLSKVVAKLDHVMPQIDQGKVEVVPPDVRGKHVVWGCVGRVEDSHLRPAIPPAACS